MSITPAFPQSDIEEIRFLCPGSSDNDIEKALYKYHGDKNLAVKDLLNNDDQKPQPKPPGTGAAPADSQRSSLRRRVVGLKNGSGRYPSVPSSGSAPQYSDQANVQQQSTTGQEMRTEE
ncbi:Ca(2+)-dependent cysteine protease, partial [Perkinsus olseni]